MARVFTMEDGGQVLVLSMEEGMVEHLARGECVIGVLSDVAPPPLPSGCYLVEREENVNMDFAKRVYARFSKVPWVIGEGERVILRELVPEDFALLYQLELETVDCKDVQSVLGLTAEIGLSGLPGLPGRASLVKTPEALPLREADVMKKRLNAYIEQQYPFYEYGMWAVCQKETNQLIGLCGFSSEDELRLSLGYHIHKDFRGQGYAVEASELALDYMQEWLQLDTAYCMILPENVNSIRVAEQLKMEQTGEENGFLVFEKQLFSLPAENGAEENGVFHFFHWLTSVAERYLRKHK